MSGDKQTSAKKLSSLSTSNEDLEDLRDLDAAIVRNQGKPGVPWSKAKATFALKCPNCGAEIHVTRSEIAKLMGGLSKGVRKPFSKAERERRRKRLAEARKLRHPGK